MFKPFNFYKWIQSTRKGSQAMNSSSQEKKNTILSGDSVFESIDAVCTALDITNSSRADSIIETSESESPESEVVCLEISSRLRNATENFFGSLSRIDQAYKLDLLDRFGKQYRNDIASALSAGQVDEIELRLQDSQQSVLAALRWNGDGNPVHFPQLSETTIEKVAFVETCLALSRSTDAEMIIRNQELPWNCLPVDDVINSSMDVVWPENAIGDAYTKQSNPSSTPSRKRRSLRGKSRNPNRSNRSQREKAHSDHAAPATLIAQCQLEVTKTGNKDFCFLQHADRDFDGGIYLNLTDVPKHSRPVKGQTVVADVIETSNGKIQACRWHIVA